MNKRNWLKTKGLSRGRKTKRATTVVRVGKLERGSLGNTASPFWEAGRQGGASRRDHAPRRMDSCRAAGCAVLPFWGGTEVLPPPAPPSAVSVRTPRALPVWWAPFCSRM